MSLRLSVLADRPDLLDVFWEMESPWPEFMRHDPLGNTYYATCLELFAEHVLVGQDETGRIVAKAHSVPFHLDGDELPDDGWDGALRRALQGRLDGTRPTLVSAIEIAVVKERQGTGLSTLMLEALREQTARLGYAELVAPVRPNGKRDVHEPMSDHAFRTRADGLPVDPWLRVHVRAGGTVEKVAPRSMVIPGTLAEWREWTGLPFDRTGTVEVPGALAPVLCDAEHGTAVYVEPNVWVRHRT